MIKASVFNTARIEALELDNLMATCDCDSCIVLNVRTESRGAHARMIIQIEMIKIGLNIRFILQMDTLHYRAGKYAPETMDAFEPNERD